MNDLTIKNDCHEDIDFIRVKIDIIITTKKY